MAEQKESTGEQNESKKVVGVTFVARDEATKVAQPGKEAFDLPATLVAAQFASVLGTGLATIAAVGCDHLNPAFSQFGIQGVGVIGTVANQTFGCIG